MGSTNKPPPADGVIFHTILRVSVCCSALVLCWPQCPDCQSADKLAACYSDRGLVRVAAAVLVTPHSCYSMADKTALLAYSVSTALPRLNYCCLCHGSVNREYGKPGDFISNRICPHVFCVLNLKVELSFLTEFCVLKRVSSCRHC